jgi:hypothetical protein
MKNVKDGKMPAPDPSTVWIISNTGVKPGIQEIKDTDDDVFNYEVKHAWDWSVAAPGLLVKADMEEEEIKRVGDVALRAHRALDCFDCWGAGAVPNVLEVGSSSPFD